MKIYIRVKAVGKKRDILSPIEYIIPDDIKSLRQLLVSIVESEVEKYNSKEPDTQLVPLLTADEIDTQLQIGKVSFGRIYSDKKADKKKACANAVTCFEDGLVRVFMDETELSELDEPLMIDDGAVFTFIRLTFLAGRMW